MMSARDTASLNVRILSYPQGSIDWHLARIGVCTASNFRLARSRVGELTDQQAKYVGCIRAGMAEGDAMVAAGYKAKPKSETVERAIQGLPVGDFSEAAKNYAFRLACERETGKLLQDGGEFDTWAMRRGHELEPEARKEHQIQAGVIVEPAGFVVTEDGRFGASADGFLVEEPAGAEYKCLVDPERIRTVLFDNSIDEFQDQVQGGMWLTGLPRWHFGLYVPALADLGGPLYWRVIERDESYIEQMEADLMRFDRLVEDTRLRLRRVCWSPDDSVFVAPDTPPWEPAPAKAAAPAAPAPKPSPEALVDNPF